MNSQANEPELSNSKTCSATSFKLAGPLAHYPSVEIVAVKTLKPSSYNARTHSKRQIRQLAKSLERFGWSAPIVIDEQNTILAGHARCKAAKLLGLREVPVIVKSGLSDVEKRAYALADNKIAANAEWNRALLAQEIDELAKTLPEINLDLQITGFEELEIQTLLGEIADCGTALSDKVAADETKHPGSKSVKTVSRLGDLWELGQDRILCGGSLLAEDIPRVARKHGAILIVPVEPNDLAAKPPHEEWDSPAQYFHEAAANEFAESVCNVPLDALKGAVNNAILFIIMDGPATRKALGTGAVLTPRIADLAIHRWQALTNQEAILAITGESFDDVAFVRRENGSGS
jgi:hypothetical protein